MKKAVITILGTIGGRYDKNLKQYIFQSNTNKSEYIGDRNLIPLIKNKYVNTLPALIDSFSEYEIIPIYTKEAKYIQAEVLKNLEDKTEYLSIFENGYEIKDENDFNEIFAIFERIFNKDYEKFIIDVTHGFRHLPLLLLIELLIKNFQDTSKIEKVLFAKELIKPSEENKFSGKYQFIDLKEYLDLANVAFVLETFSKNYTLASHIYLSDKFKNLEEYLKNFSEDILVLNIERLFNESVIKLIDELEVLKDKKENISLKNQIGLLIDHLKNIFEYKDKYRFETYYKLAKELKEKGYLLNSIALLYESERLFIEFFLSLKHPNLTKKIRNYYKDDYKVGDFYMNKIFKTTKKYIKENFEKDKDIKKILSFEEYEKLVKSIPFEFKKWKQCYFSDKKTDIFRCIAYARNNFAHAKSSNSYAEIKKIIDDLFADYEKIIKKSI